MKTSIYSINPSSGTAPSTKFESILGNKSTNINNDEKMKDNKGNTSISLSLQITLKLLFVISQLLAKTPAMIVKTQHSEYKKFAYKYRRTFK